MIELRQLRYFLVLAEEENFRRASARLHVDQSAVSRQIQDLEDQLGFSLFERASRGIRLSKAGRVYAEHVRRIFSELGHAKEAGEGVARSQSAVLSLGVSDLSLHYPVVTRTLRTFRKEHPEIDLNLTVLSSPQQRTAYEEMQALDGGFLMDLKPSAHAGAQELSAGGGQEVDASGIMLDPANEYHFESVEILSDEVVVFMPWDHPLAGHSTITLSELSKETLIRRPWPSAANIDRMLGARDFKPRRVLDAGSIDAVFHLIEAGLGVAVLVTSLADASQGAVVSRPIADFSATTALRFAWPRRPPESALLHFVHVLRSMIKREVGGNSARASGTQ